MKAVDITVFAHVMTERWMDRQTDGFAITTIYCQGGVPPRPTASNPLPPTPRTSHPSLTKLMLNYVGRRREGKVEVVKKRHLCT